MLIVLVNGISATGKTTLARELAPLLGLPLFTKDDVKERLFDDLGVRDREWAHHLSGTTHAVMNYVLETLLRAGVGFVMEANFNPQFDTAKYRDWAESYGAKIVQVLCVADGEVVFERFKARVADGSRHPGHCDGDNIERWRDYLMNGRCEPLDLGGRVIEVDTTHPEPDRARRLADELHGHDQS
ncbi:MAG: ATP-binding protein [Armatimonadetes bacterium]|nr:ATP-binding protein [Armatimonadota bacterium]